MAIYLMLVEKAWGINLLLNMKGAAEILEI